MSGQTNPYNLPYPVDSDPVDVAGDIQALADILATVLPGLGLPYHPLTVTNTSGEALDAGTPVYITGYSSKPTIAKSKANDINTFPVIGLLKTDVNNGSDAVVIVSGLLTGIDTTSFAAGDILYVGENGGLVNTIPVTSSSSIGVVAYSDESGIIILGQTKGGNGTWGALKEGI